MIPIRVTSSGPVNTQQAWSGHRVATIARLVASGSGIAMGAATCKVYDSLNSGSGIDAFVDLRSVQGESDQAYLNYLTAYGAYVEISGAGAVVTLWHR